MNEHGSIKSPNTIGIYLNGLIQDSSGNWTSETDYINKVTPQKQALSFSDSASETTVEAAQNEHVSKFHSSQIE